MSDCALPQPTSRETIAAELESSGGSGGMGRLNGLVRAYGVQQADGQVPAPNVPHADEHAGPGSAASSAVLPAVSTPPTTAVTQKVYVEPLLRLRTVYWLSSDRSADRISAPACRMWTM